MKFQREEELPVKFSNAMIPSLCHQKGCVKQMLRMLGWDGESPNDLKLQRDIEIGRQLVLFMPPDCLSRMLTEKEPKEGTVQHANLRGKQEFQCRVVLGESTHVVAVGQRGITHSFATLSKLLTAHQLHSIRNC